MFHPPNFLRPYLMVHTFLSAPDTKSTLLRPRLAPPEHFRVFENPYSGTVVTASFKSQYQKRFGAAASATHTTCTAPNPF
jgi:hypothetical protein